MSVPQRVTTGEAPQHLREVLNRMLDGNSFGVGMPPASQRVPIDVLETANHYVVEAALPGVKPADLEVAAAGRTIMIHATTRRGEDERHNGMDIEEGGGEDEEGGPVYVRRERFTDDLTRTLELPGEVDASKVEATYEHGLLTLWIPKTAPVAPKRIAVYPQEQ